MPNPPPPHSSKSYTWTTEAETIGQRLDRVLKQRFPTLSNKVIQSWLKRGAVKLNKRPGKAGYRLKGGEQITITDLTPLKAMTRGEPLPLELLLEHPDLLAVNKPADQPAHPLTPWETETTTQAVLYRYPELHGIGEARAPGLLHRLDNQTSGVLLFARSQRIYEQLLEARKAQRWKKWYLAWIRGRLEKPCQIDTPIAHHPKNKQKMCTLRTPDEPHRGTPRSAKTSVYPLAYESTEDIEEGRTAVKIEIDLGARHQIRVHLASIGHPVWGDPLYGDSDKDLIGPMCLHAWKMILPAPPLEAPLQIEAPPPFSFPQLETKSAPATP